MDHTCSFERVNSTVKCPRCILERAALEVRKINGKEPLFEDESRPLGMGIPPKHDRTRMTTREQEVLLDGPARVARRRFRRALSDVARLEPFLYSYSVENRNGALPAMAKPGFEVFGLAYDKALKTALEAAKVYAESEGDAYSEVSSLL